MGRGGGGVSKKKDFKISQTFKNENFRGEFIQKNRIAEVTGLLKTLKYYIRKNTILIQTYNQSKPV